MMPSPVNSAPRPAPPAPGKPPSTPPPADATGAEGFREELTRQRRPEAPARSSSESTSAKRAEPKRPTNPKGGKPIRPGRRDRAPEEPQVRARLSGEVGASKSGGATAPADDADVGAAEAHPEGETAPTPDAKDEHKDEHPDIVDPSAAPAAGIALTTAPIPAQLEAPETPGSDDASAEGEAQLLAEPLPRTVFHAGDGRANTEQDGATGERSHQPPAAQPAANKLAPLFGDTSANPKPAGADTGDSAAPDGAAQPAQVLPGDDASLQAIAAAQAPSIAAERPAHGPAEGSDPAAAPPVAFTELRLATPHMGTAPVALDVPPPEARFAAANHENIVTSMRAEVLPNGGTMRLRLDPPQLGAMNVTVRIQDGLITAAFETSSDEATRLLGHSLNQLKSVLESHGVGVDRLQVTQAPRESQPASTQGDTPRDGNGQRSPEQEQSARQEQQRREMLRQMWRRLTGQPDPLDLTA